MTSVSDRWVRLLDVNHENNLKVKFDIDKCLSDDEYAELVKKSGKTREVELEDAYAWHKHGDYDRNPVKGDDPKINPHKYFFARDGRAFLHYTAKENYEGRAVLIESQEGWVRGDNPKDIKNGLKNIKMKKDKSKLPHSLDAWDWAEEFHEIVGENPTIPYDKEAMVGWFANVIMAGWDEMARIKDKEDENRWVYVLIDQQTGETIALYSEEPTKEKCDRDYSLHLGKDLEWSVKNVLYIDGQDSAWNCNLRRMKVDSLNRMTEVVEIESLKQYENI